MGGVADKIAGGLGLDKVIDAGKDIVGGITGKTAADASKAAARTQAEAQMQALNYLREREAIPQEFREGALQRLGGLMGLPGGEAGAVSAIERNPIFQATLGQLPQQEEAILRNASATGALRTGGTEAMLAENQRQNRLQAFQNTMGGLQGLAELQSYAPQIASGMAGIGQTQAQGMIGAAQARQQGMGNMLGLGMNALALAGFSDLRLKKNIKPAGSRYGHDWYEWEWNDRAETELCLTGKTEGVLAQDVAKVMPEAVGTSHGYLTVNYEMLEAAHG